MTSLIKYNECHSYRTGVLVTANDHHRSAYAGSPRCSIA